VRPVPLTCVFVTLGAWAVTHECLSSSGQRGLHTRTTRSQKAPFRGAGDQSWCQSRIQMLLKQGFLSPIGLSQDRPEHPWRKHAAEKDPSQSHLSHSRCFQSLPFPSAGLTHALVGSCSFPLPLLQRGDTCSQPAPELSLLYRLER